MSLAKISKDIKADLDVYKNEIIQKKTLSSKQKTSRLSKAEKRQTRHRAMRQGIDDMLHEQMRHVDSISHNIKLVPIDNEKMKFENML
mmetsp:Transcript_3878/g.5882  ORF Transcript_3878/g.5882 Transcript_3878/m.5882 type:complete len:88 (+) Transcript_3878:220-483(+)